MSLTASDFLTFSIYMLTEDEQQKMKKKKNGEYTLFDPSNCGPPKIWPLMTAYDPLFLGKIFFYVCKKLVVVVEHLGSFNLCWANEAFSRGLLQVGF